MAKNALIKEISDKYGWTQADIKRAIEFAQDEVETEADVVACMIHYAGPVLLQRNRELGARKRVTNQQQQVIENLIAQLTKVEDFYATQLIPTLKSTINAQAEYIKELLSSFGDKQGGSRG